MVLPFQQILCEKCCGSDRNKISRIQIVPVNNFSFPCMTCLLCLTFTQSWMMASMVKFMKML